MNRLSELILATIFGRRRGPFCVRDVNTDIRQHLPSAQASDSARPMRFRLCGANEFERVWTLFVSLMSPKCIDREQTRQREQQEQSIYQLFWYLSANVALGIYFYLSIFSFSAWLYVTPCYIWKSNYFGCNFKLKKLIIIIIIKQSHHGASRIFMN